MEYRRYHIETAPAPDLEEWPSRFKVRVGRVGLAKLLLQELWHFRGDLEVVLSRPCIYGVFSGPLGGFAPRERLCVGCLRCTTQYPEFVGVQPNPERQALGDSYFDFRAVEAVNYEAGTGRIPVKGAGYRGRFGGPGWDGIWTDMSEIVRPTRDGIHGREFISTAVDIGSKTRALRFDAAGAPIGPLPRTFQLPLPILYDAPPPTVASPLLNEIFARSAAAVQGLALLPAEALVGQSWAGPHAAPLVTAESAAALASLPVAPRMIQIDGWDAGLWKALQADFPATLVSLRLPFGADLLALAEEGVRVFHLTADYHGRSADGRFAFDLIRQAHCAFVNAGRRDQVTLIGSGGLVAAEHVPKAIIAGLDAVVLDTPLLVALQATFNGPMRERETAAAALPANLNLEWGVQRLNNLMAAWRDQLLEILGAMGIREVRRLRGEMGRALFAAELERDAFAGIPGYPVTAAGEPR